MYPITAALLFSLLFSIRSSAVSSPSPYDILQTYNFPVGILPQGATGYDLHADTGDFTANFNSTCSFSLEGSYQLRYQPKITGRISDSRLRDLKGVSVKILFLWVNIVEVDRIGDQLEFSVGIASADFPAVNFEESPQCGCGMDCVGEEKNGKATMRIKLRGSNLAVF